MYFHFRYYLALSLLSSICHAATIVSFVQTKTDINVEKRGLEIDLNRIAVNFTQSSLSNQNLYTAFSDSNLRGNSQLSTQFFLTLNVNYYANRFVIFNSLISEYGFTQIRQNDSSFVTNKNLDKILFSTDYTQRVWDFDFGFESFELGPYIKLSYQTEFQPTINIGRRHIINYLGGVKLFDGKYIKSLYLDLFAEHDLNRATQFSGGGYEFGFSAEYKLNSGVKFLYSMNFKQYFFNSSESKIKPSYQFLIEARMEANLFKSFSMSPNLRYYVLKAENIDIAASNFLVGVSINFGKVILPPSKPLNDYDFSN